MMNGRALTVAATFAATVAVYGFVNRLTIAHIALIGLVVALVAVRRSRWVGMALIPVLIFVLMYDLLRVFAQRAIDIVVIKPIYDLEAAIFGIDVDGVIMLPTEWIVAHLSTPLDLLGGVVYATHIIPILLVGVWLMWRHRALEPDDERTIATYFWGLLLLNLVAYTTMALMPVAPPWYVETYGFVRPDEIVIGNPGRLARVDEWLGFAYFQGIYEQGAYTFGAVPSLHCAYPVFAALHVRKFWARSIAWFWAILMMFYAVYLNHHYILDLVAGTGLAVGVWALMKWRLGDAATRLYRWQLSLFGPGHDEVSKSVG